MSKLTCAVMLATLVALTAPVAAQTPVPDLRGTWKGTSESIAQGGAHPHHPGQPGEPRFDSIAFTLTVDKQDGRRFSGTFASSRGTDPLIGIVSRNGTIFVVDDDGYTLGTMLAPDRMEWCYMHLRRSQATRVASCTELTKQ